MGYWKILCRYFCSCTKLKGSSDESICSRFVDSKIFMPEFNILSRNLIILPVSFHMPFEIVSIKTSDGFKLMAFLIIHTDKDYSNFPTIIMYHGNGGNIGDCLPLAEILYTAMDCNILIVEYRGYGFSEGIPSERGVYLDAQAAFDFVESRSDLDSTRIIIYGISMGGAVAIDLATREEYKDRVAVMIIENTFSSLMELVVYQIPKCCVPLSKLFKLSEKFPNYRKIPAVKCPTLFISGLNDTFIPPAQMTKLFSISKSRRKKILRFPEGGHLNTFGVTGYGGRVAEFIYSALRNYPVVKNGLNNNQNFLDEPNSHKEMTLAEFLNSISRS